MSNKSCWTNNDNNNNNNNRRMIEMLKSCSVIGREFIDGIHFILTMMSHQQTQQWITRYFTLFFTEFDTQTCWNAMSLIIKYLSHPFCSPHPNVHIQSKSTTLRRSLQLFYQHFHSLNIFKLFPSLSTFDINDCAPQRILLLILNYNLFFFFFWVKVALVELPFKMASKGILKL